MARRKGTGVMLELLDAALKAGHRAKYVLFDSRFSNPRQLVQISQRGLSAIGMIKKTGTILYEHEGERKGIKEIFASSRKRRGRSRYLLSAKVRVGNEERDGAAIEATVVCVRNRANRKDWIALICTDPSLSEDEVIRIYGKRWGIETFFKTCKSFLHLGKEYHGLSYDALTAHVALVFTRYMLLSVIKRNGEDHRTMGEIFYILISEMADITFGRSMQLLLKAFQESLDYGLHLGEGQVERLVKDFVSRLPMYLQRPLLRAACV